MAEMMLFGLPGRTAKQLGLPFADSVARVQRCTTSLLRFVGSRAYGETGK